MAVAVPKRSTAPAPPPARTSPPKRKAPQRKAAVAAPAPSKRRKAASPRGGVAAPAPARRAPARRAPARRAPQPAKPRTRRNPGARVIPFAGRTAVAVGQLPDSGLVVRLTRGRAWIGLLGVLLVGIVALNVVTLSFAASTGGLDGQISALDRENRILEVRAAQKSATGRVRGAGAEAGFAQAPGDLVKVAQFDRNTIAAAAARLAALSP